MDRVLIMYENGHIRIMNISVTPTVRCGARIGLDGWKLIKRNIPSKAASQASQLFTVTCTWNEKLIMRVCNAYMHSVNGKVALSRNVAYFRGGRLDQAAKIWAIWGEARCQGAWGAGSRLPAQYFQHCKNIFIMTKSISSTARIFSLRLKVFPVLPKKTISYFLYI